MKPSDYSIKAIQKAIRELVESQKETGKLIRELRDSQKETDKQIKGTDKQIKGTDGQIKELRDSHKETEDLVKRTNKSVAELTDGWGMFVEGLAAPSIPKIFNRLGYHITQHGVRQKSRLRSRSMEMDIIAAGTRDGRATVTIATSVKSRLQIDDVKEHIAHLEEFFRFYPQYAGSELLGVVVGIRLDEGVVKYAQKHGLYVIGSSGEAVELLNKKGFKPHIWKEDTRRVKYKKL